MCQWCIAGATLQNDRTSTGDSKITIAEEHFDMRRQYFQAASGGRLVKLVEENFGSLLV